MGGDRNLILTPTARLARAESRRLAEAHISAGAQAWRRPDVLAFPSWIQRLQADALLAGDDPRAPLGDAAAEELWREVIDPDIFIGEPRVAELASTAWRRIHEYRLKPPEQWPELLLSEDSRRFRDWAARYRALCERRGLADEWQLAAALPECIREGVVAVPESVTLQGFELPLTPLQEAILEAAANAGCTVERPSPADDAPPVPPLRRFVDGPAELAAAATWARGQVESDPQRRVAVVVRDLAERLADVERVFRQAFDPPGFALEDAGPEPWHISLGPRMAQWPLVADALAMLRLDPQRMAQPEAARVLRCPFIAGAEPEHAARARAVAEMSGRRPHWIHAGQLGWIAGHCGAGTLQQALAAWEALRRKHRDPARPSAWVARFQEELKALGFGHGRGLDSREYQVLQRFHGLLEEFAALDLVARPSLSRARALRQLAARAATIAFRERNPGTPVEILGVEEALGSRFDAVWITTLDQDTWPAPARRDPLIPGPLQAHVPTATGDGCLARARTELAGLMGTAGEVCCSFSRGSGEAERLPTPLVADAPVIDGDGPAPAETVALASIAEDTRAPAFPGGALRGGTGVLQAQSDCPFRAFATWRLGAGDLAPPRPGLDARARGSLVHRALEAFWQDLEGSAALKALDANARDERIDRAVESALAHFESHSPLALSPTGRRLEARCLARALRGWLGLEAGREAFTIAALEAPVEMQFGALQLTGKIDRVDALAGGDTLVIDYKTGDASRNGWYPAERLADVQLPAYAVSLPQPPAGIAFGKLRPDKLGFEGIAGTDPGTPGVAVIGLMSGRARFADIESWTDLIRAWREELDGLAANFVAGAAQVDPRDAGVCTYCHLHALCRIHERAGVRREEPDDG